MRMKDIISILLACYTYHTNNVSKVGDHDFSSLALE